MFKTNENAILENIFQCMADKVAELVIARMSDTQKDSAIKVERTKICGIRGLAQLLGCSTATAQRLKNEKRVPYYNMGTRTFFYADEVINSLKVNDIHK